MNPGGHSGYELQRDTGSDQTVLRSFRPLLTGSGAPPAVGSEPVALPEGTARGFSLL